MNEKQVTYEEFLHEAESIMEKSMESPCQICLPTPPPLQIRINKDCNIPLFRGVSKSIYELETSLDRVKRNMTLTEYSKIVGQASERLSAKQREAYSISNSKDAYVNYQKSRSFFRHFGLPSPELDWTANPYIALFFAFSDIYSKDDKAIYVYRSDLKMQPQYDYLFVEYDVTCSKSPQDHFNRRAQKQESFFSTCLSKNGSRLSFGYHHDVVSKSDELLIKYILPQRERKKVLKVLSLKKICFCSLFGKTQDNKFKDFALARF